MKAIFDLVLLLAILAINLFILFSFFGFFIGTTAGAPFVPTGYKIARQMIVFAKIKNGEKVFDLGCGDGRLVFLAAEQGAEAVGVEISYPIFLWAKILQKLGRKGGTLLRASLWDIDLRDADVIFLYLLPKMMARFETEVLPTLKKGCRIITHGFELKNHTPEKKWLPEGKKTGRILVYVKK